MIDFIGDIHGHADKLKALLLKMGYSLKNGSHSHPERKVLFVGDCIDREPKIRETLDIVRRMVDNGCLKGSIFLIKMVPSAPKFALNGGKTRLKPIIKAIA